MNDIATGAPVRRIYRLPMLWSTVVAFGHGAKIMANGHIGRDRDGRECLLALHPQDYMCAMLGCRQIVITGSILEADL